MIRIAQPTFDAVLNHARTTFPEECCGILLGGVSFDATLVGRTVAAANIAEGDRRHAYQVDWRTLFEAVRTTRYGPDRIVGFYHSHPDGSTRPSKRDIEHAWTDHTYLIVSTRESSTPLVTAWRVTSGHNTFLEETIRMVERSSPRRAELTA